MQTCTKHLHCPHAFPSACAFYTDLMDAIATVDPEDRAEYAKLAAEETRAFERQGSGADEGNEA